MRTSTAYGVVFDVDGTLVDSAYLHAVCWHEALRQGGHTVPMLEVHRAIGLGSDETLDDLLPADRDRRHDQEMLDAHLALYKLHWGRLTPLPGARELLRRCAAAGLRVVLSSSASADELAELRSTLDCDDAIHSATSSTDVDAGKPAPAVIDAALQKSGLAAGNAVYVGDAVWDGVTTRRAGIGFVGVLCGGTPAELLYGAGAVEVWRDPAELVDKLEDSIIGQLAQRAS